MYKYLQSEIRPDEICVGNTDKPERPELAHIAGLRFGKVALDIDGNKLPPEYRPIFVKQGAAYDEYNRAMDAKLAAIRGA